MKPATLEKLRVIVGVALAMVPGKLRRAYGEKLAGISEPAKLVMAEAIAADIDRMFEVEEKPPAPYGPSLHSGLTQAAGTRDSPSIDTSKR